MSRIMTKTLEVTDRSASWAVQATLVVGASLLVALCARISVPLPFTPVPLTLQNLAVLLVGLLLGSRAGLAALSLYLVEGASGFPVFTPGPGGIAQLLGPTGGFLCAYPFVAWLAGYIFEQLRPRVLAGRTQSNFVRALIASTAAEVLLFAGGLSWLFILTHSVALAFRWGLYWFFFAEIIKIMLAAGIASAWQLGRRTDL